MYNILLYFFRFLEQPCDLGSDYGLGVKLRPASEYIW